MCNLEVSNICKQQRTTINTSFSVYFCQFFFSINIAVILCKIYYVYSLHTYPLKIPKFHGSRTPFFSVKKGAYQFHRKGNIIAKPQLSRANIQINTKKEKRKEKI